MGASRSGLLGMVAVGLAVAGCGSGGAVRTVGQLKPPPTTERSKPPLRASAAAVQRFVNRTQKAPLHSRFTATYRVAVVRSRGRVLRGLVFVSSWAPDRLRFLERPGFSGSLPPTHAYEVLEGSGRYAISCSQARRGARWYCISEKGEGMGGMAMQNGAIVPGAFLLGLTNAVAEAAPRGLFLGRATVDGRPVRCLSFGTAQGDYGRVCATDRGLIVSYRLPARLIGNVYDTADLVSYSTRVNRSVLTPPAKPSCPAC